MANTMLSSIKRPALLALIAAAGVLVVVAVAGAGTHEDVPTFGNHNLNGLYEFRADGEVQEDDSQSRGFWEIGRFRADGAGRISDGVEYSSLLSSSDEEAIDRPFTFDGTYQVNPDGTATGEVTVVIAPGVQIEKKLWLIVHSVGKGGIANGFDGGHAHADLGGGAHGNARSHEGHRMETAK